MSLEDKWIFSRIINLINKFACIFIRLLKSFQPSLMSVGVIIVSFTFCNLLQFRACKKSPPLPFDFLEDPHTPDSRAIAHSVAWRLAFWENPQRELTVASSSPSRLFFLLFFPLGPGSLILPLLALLGTSWHQFWLQISWVARLHHVKIAISLYLCRAIFKGSKVWRSRLAAWQAPARGYQHTGVWPTRPDSTQRWEQKEWRGGERKCIFTYCRHMATRPAEIYLITNCAHWGEKHSEGKKESVYTAILFYFNFSPHFF